MLKDGGDKEIGDIQTEIVAEVRKEIGAVASFKEVHPVKRLPKTRSGKILRRLLRDMADQKEFKVPSTIDDVNIISEIEDVYKINKIGKR